MEQCQGHVSMIHIFSTSDVICWLLLLLAHPVFNPQVKKWKTRKWFVYCPLAQSKPIRILCSIWLPKIEIKEEMCSVVFLSFIFLPKHIIQILYLVSKNAINRKKWTKAVWCDIEAWDNVWLVSIQTLSIPSIRRQQFIRHIEKRKGTKGR